MASVGSDIASGSNKEEVASASPASKPHADNSTVARAEESKGDGGTVADLTAQFKQWHEAAEEYKRTQEAEEIAKQIGASLEVTSDNGLEVRRHSRQRSSVGADEIRAAQMQAMALVLEDGDDTVVHLNPLHAGRVDGASSAALRSNNTALRSNNKSNSPEY